MIRIDRDSREPVYRQVREKLQALIRDGVLKPGQKLPPSRRLAAELRVNRNTVVAAYEELEADGLVRSHVGRGTFIAGGVQARSAAAAQSPAFNWHTRLAAAADHSDFFAEMLHAAPSGGVPLRYSFGAGFPPAGFFPIEDLQKAFHAALREEGAEVFNYGAVEGLESLREQVARGIRSVGGAVSARDVLITSGSQQAIALAARALVEPGDIVAVEEPSYPGALSVLRELKARILGIPLEKDGLDLNAFEDACRRHAPKLLYTVPDFQNPAGCVLGPDKREPLVRLAERYGVPLIEDDSFRDLRYQGEDLPPLKAFDRSGVVVYINSVSKKTMPALRVGWAAIPPGLAARVAALKSADDLGTSSLCQVLLEKFLARGYYRAHIRRVRAAYRERRDAMWDAIVRHFPSDARLEKPAGGMFLWVTLPEAVDVTAVAAESRGRGLVFCPGPVFYASAHGRNQMRLSFTAHPPAEIDAGIALLGQLLKRMSRGTGGPRSGVKVPLV